ncbi:HotDog domain-containing protein [Aspergillus varians]
MPDGVGERSDFLRAFLRSHKPLASTINFFRSIEWSRKILENNNYEAIPFFSRHLHEQTGENRFFARTVNTPTTIPHVLALRARRLITPPSATPSLAKNETPEALCLISLGKDLEAHPSIVHGGFQCVIFDEVMRLVVLLHQDNIAEPGPRDVHFTVSMTTSYHAPVNAPSNVLVRSWLVKREGRKWFAGADLVDCDGRVLTRAESVWVTRRSKE